MAKWKKIAKVYCVENNEIIEYAEKLCKSNIRTKDALHIACGVYTNSDYFITTDKQSRRRRKSNAMAPIID